MNQKQTKKTYHLELYLHRFCAILFTNILYVSFGFKLISNIEDAIVYNTIGAHAAEPRGGTFRLGLANHNTLDQLNQSCISEGEAS